MISDLYKSYIGHCSDYPKSLISRINEVYDFSIKYRNSDILLKKNVNFIYNRLVCCNRTRYCVKVVSVTSASRYITAASHYHPRYQSMYIRGLIPRNFAELAEVVPLAGRRVHIV